VRDDGRGLFVSRWAADGTPSWSRTFPAPQGIVYARALALDAFGDVHVAGGYSGEVNFGDATFITVRRSIPFIVKLDREGKHLWSRELAGAEGSAAGVAVGVDRVFVTGTFEGAYHFHKLPHFSEGQDGFVVAFDSSGGERWARSLGSSGLAIATAEGGDIFVAGGHDGGHDVGASAWAPGLYVAKLLQDDGGSVWVRGIEAARPLSATTLAARETGDAVLGGVMSGGAFVTALSP